jgi:hypothetical protein
MQRKRTCRLAAIVMGIMLLVAGNGLDPATLDAETKVDLSKVQVKWIGVTPFFRGAFGVDIEGPLRGPLSDLTLDPEDLAPGAEGILTGYVHQELEKRYGERAVPLTKTREIYGVMPQDNKVDTPLSVTKRLGEALEANLMVLGTVRKYRRRTADTGEGYRGVAMAFTVYFIDVTTGKVLWQDRFAESQSSFSDDILRRKKGVKKGMRWLTADEMARHGVKEIFDRCPLRATSR